MSEHLEAKKSVKSIILIQFNAAVYWFNRSKCSIMIQLVLKIVYMSFAVLYLYRGCIISVSPFNWLCYVF